MKFYYKPDDDHFKHREKNNNRSRCLAYYLLDDDVRKSRVFESSIDYISISFKDILEKLLDVEPPYNYHEYQIYFEREDGTRYNLNMSELINNNVLGTCCPIEEYLCVEKINYINIE